MNSVEWEVLAAGLELDWVIDNDSQKTDHN